MSPAVGIHRPMKCAHRCANACDRPVRTSLSAPDVRSTTSWAACSRGSRRAFRLAGTAPQLALAVDKGGAAREQQAAGRPEHDAACRERANTQPKSSGNSGCPLQKSSVRSQPAKSGQAERDRHRIWRGMHPKDQSPMLGHRFTVRGFGLGPKRAKRCADGGRTIF